MGSPNSLLSANTFPYNRVINESVITLGYILLPIDNSCQKSTVILPKRNNTSSLGVLQTGCVVGDLEIFCNDLNNK